MMRRLTALFAVLAAVAMLGPLSGVTNAFTVTWNGTVIAQDDIESEGLGNPYEAEVGEWQHSHRGGATTLATLITGDSYANDPAHFEIQGPTKAFSGDHYVARHRRNGAHGNENAMVLDLSANGGNLYGASGGVMTIKTMMYLPGEQGGDGYYSSANSIAIVDQYTSPHGEDGTDFAYVTAGPATGTNWTDAFTGSALAPHTFDKWMLVEIVLDFDNMQTQLTVDGKTLGPVASHAAGLVGRVFWRGETGGGLFIGHYLDAIPEPASMALLAGGGLLLLSRRRRKA